jgi:prepilin peptidase CpaA
MTGRIVVAALFTAALVWGAVTDMQVRKIRNVTVLAVIALFLPWALVGGWPAAVSGLEAGGLALVVGVALYAFGVVGAGDAKFFAAVSLFAGMGGMLELTMLTALAGGVLALITVASRPREVMVMVAMKGKSNFGRGIPYGVAISVGGVTTIWATLLSAHPL